MAFGVKIIADSVSPAGIRLTTLTATYPRFIHAEVMTHRMLARNAASSRAIPWAKMREAIIDDPVIPIHWGAEQKGMQSGPGLSEDAQYRAEIEWFKARDAALSAADHLSDLRVHKSLVNRLVEPWMWITTLISATEWQNFFRLRVHPDAERHFQKIAGMIQEAMAASTPMPMPTDQWHLPFIDYEDRLLAAVAPPDAWSSRAKIQAMDLLKRVSAARCARISYLTHDGRRSIEDDLALFDKLINRSDNVIHASPLEHVATPTWPSKWSGPFRGWEQYRKEFVNENLAG